MRVGSVDHKELFCRTFFEGHEKYEPADLAWPELNEEELQLLRSLPFWTHALQFESDAGPMIRQVAALENDLMLREALELQAYEEERHARLVQHAIDRYELPHDPPKDVPIPDPIREFTQFGFDECLDSFGAFGLFALARDAKLLPDGIFQIFGNVMREESHHIVFFINWYAHRQTNLGSTERALRPVRSVWHYGKALLEIADLVKDDGAEDGADFIVTGAQAFVDDLTPQKVIHACVTENEWRMARFDRRLLLPRLVPTLAAAAGATLRLLPERSVAWFTGDSGSKTDPSERTPRAA
ncbi:MAG: ferritin-like domain-containing protein [Myxococcota bacterium]|nr:ferritin-like domain-containing protein [Myxococcota bacterium]